MVPRKPCCNPDVTNSLVRDARGHMGLYYSQEELNFILVCLIHTKSQYRELLFWHVQSKIKVCVQAWVHTLVTSLPLYVKLLL